MRATSQLHEGRNLFAKHGCCKRQVRSVYIGHDLSGSPVSFDLGTCQAHCGVTPRKRASGFAGISRQTSMLDFLKAKRVRLQERLPSSLAGSEPSTRLEHSCPANYRCEPSSIRVQEFLLLEGVRQVEVIESCQCNASPSECLRLPSLKTFFPDSPLEQTLDVGRCSNPEQPKGNGLFCLPTDFDSVLMKTPNGHRAVQILGSCQLREPCYRVSHVESYYEVVLNSAGEKLELIKEIDVGRCLGQCPPGSPCLLRDPHSEGKCLVWGEDISSSCIPHQYETNTFRSRSGELRTVFAIQACKCGVLKGLEQAPPKTRSFI
ncbi:uncharacterized protein LOC118086062 [Zootoca vivipara]|uniref:uncharacterized protein LOC118086062 n=1 Tax=Zootoca vivipara TaxID=8524 RepID=UPI0015900DCD|nr:uncharacterized protein LOC118086062 [Zootoca vivipara]